jgi:hypothetical protein
LWTRSLRPQGRQRPRPLRRREKVPCRLRPLKIPVMIREPELG